MVPIPGYRTLETLSANLSYVVMRAEQESSGRHVILKTTFSPLPDLKDKARLERELDIIQRMDPQIAVPAIGLEYAGNRPVLVLEDIGGITLREWYAARTHSFVDKLKVAGDICSALQRVHVHGIIHRDLKPENILIDERNARVRLIDFGLSVPVSSQERRGIVNPVIEGTLAYISPEQTGRINRSVDLRSDHYSLGICLYELFTGKLPFAETDPARLIHQQLALNPEPPHEAAKGIGAALSSVILKLMRKNPDERYQNLDALLGDLQLCQRIATGSASETDFVPGKEDFSSQIQISEKLYGRDEEVRELKDVFLRVSRGEKEWVEIAGHAGTGKSSLVQELLPLVASCQGVFIAGKFDKLRKEKPHYAFASALSRFADHLLSADEAALNEWKRKFAETMGAMSGVITELVPEISIIASKTEKPPVVPPEEQRVRFTLAIRRFVGMMADAKQPVALFLDDLQWADIESINLIGEILRDPEIRYLNLILAYRSEELESSNPIHLLIAELREKYPSRLITLGPLKRDDVREMIEDTFHQQGHETEEFSSILFEKTHGNPFFLNRFLNQLIEQGEIQFDKSRKRWTWESAAIQSRSITENVIRYISEGIEKLPLDLLMLLKTASCIGHRFSLSLLSTVTGQSRHSIAVTLQRAVQMRIIKPESDDYLLVAGAASAEGTGTQLDATLHFVHDRVQEAVFSLCNDEEKVNLHYRIGLTCLENYSEADLKGNIYDVVNHLNLAALQITRDSLRLRIAHLNYEAGIRARASNAFSVAENYIRNGISFLPSLCWETEYRLAFQLHLEHGTVLYLMGEGQDALKRFEECYLRAHDRLDKLRVLSAQNFLFLHAGEYVQNFEVGRKALALFDIHLPDTPNKVMFATMVELAKSSWKLWGKKDEQILFMHQTLEEDLRMLFTFIQVWTITLFIAYPQWYGWVSLKALNLLMRKGLVDPHGCSVFLAYGLIRLMAFRDYESGYRYGKLALSFFDHYPSYTYRERVEFGFISGISPFREPARPNVDRLFHIYKKSLEHGDLLMANWSMSQRMWVMAALGYPMDVMERDCVSFMGFLKEKKDDPNLLVNLSLLQWVKNLGGETEKPWLLEGREFAYSAVRESLVRDRKYSVVTGAAFRETQLRVIFAKYEDIATLISDGEAYRNNVLHVEMQTEFAFYQTLLLLRAGDAVPADRRKWAKKMVRTNMDHLSKWASMCSENFLPMHQIARGALHEYLGESDKALEFYTQGISSARQYGFIQHRGLAAEFGARLLLAQGHSLQAVGMLEEAAYAWKEWGAIGKLKQLQNEFPDVLLPRMGAVPANPHFGDIRHSSSSSEHSVLDLNSVMKSSTAISREIAMDKLLGELMHILIENAGAESGFMILNSDGQLLIQAQSTASGSRIEVMNGIPVTGNGRVPESVIRYVDHKHETLILFDASRDERFQEDKEIRRLEIHSLLCAPILNKGKLLGIIYLENNLAPGIFTPERQQLIDLLSGQIAVSLENSFIYENLEQKVRERTALIEKQKDVIGKEKEKSDNLLLNILPFETAEELKQTGRYMPRKYENVTILFADFEGFTKLTEGLSAEQLVEMIDTFYRGFDQIVRRHGIEKIKTIGDAYMCAGGIPVADPDHAARVIRSAIDMIHCVNAINAERQAQGLATGRVRIGINSGPVIAGVVGSTKFAYDIWGDAVNLASRMESAGEVGKINISKSTWELVKGQFQCTYRGKIEAKNKGQVDMYFVDAGLPETVNTGWGEAGREQN